eukprot:8401550-Pyramimonas_sp.AAC.1
MTASMRTAARALSPARPLVSNTQGVMSRPAYRRRFSRSSCAAAAPSLLAAVRTLAGSWWAPTTAAMSSATRLPSKLKTTSRMSPG